jgi:hypothetical protein
MINMMMMGEKEVVGNTAPVTQATGEEALASPGASNSEWEKLKKLVYQQFGGKYIIVEKENEIAIEGFGLKILIEKDTEAHAYDYWTILVQTKHLSAFISTGLLECEYNAETIYGRVEVNIKNKWNPEEDLYDNINAESAVETIKELIQKYEENYEEGLVVWFFNTFFG